MIYLSKVIWKRHLLRKFCGIFCRTKLPSRRSYCDIRCIKIRQSSKKCFEL